VIAQALSLENTQAEIVKKGRELKINAALTKGAIRGPPKEDCCRSNPNKINVRATIRVVTIIALGFCPHLTKFPFKDVQQAICTILSSPFKKKEYSTYLQFFIFKTHFISTRIISYSFKLFFNLLG
jgi:hypothetical protein